MNQIKVWDLAVRLLHWSLAIAFTAAFISGENELSIHEYAGYTVLGLVLFRIVWGFIGTRYARFSNFIYGPREVFAYLRSLLKGKPLHYLGHNPAGGWMVIALLSSLLVAGVSGWQLEKADERSAPEVASMVTGVAADASVLHDTEHAVDSAANHEHKHQHKHGESVWDEVHDVSAHLCLVLVILHILGVAASSYLHKEALVTAMITGFKKR